MNGHPSWRWRWSWSWSWSWKGTAAAALCALAAGAEEFSANRRQQKCDNISMKLFINRLAHIALAHSPPGSLLSQLAAGYSSLIACANSCSSSADHASAILVEFLRKLHTSRLPDNSTEVFTCNITFSPPLSPLSALFCPIDRFVGRLLCKV